jgi:RHS repeat-associated protein
MTGTALQKSFIALPGGSTAVYTASGLDHYRHPDWLGSSRFTSSTARTATGFASYAPFGETVASNTPDLSFTGQNQDTTSGLYDFLYREFDPLPGRWPTPDPAGLAAVSLDNPQSLNRYSYVMNMPTSLVDPLGLDPCQGSNIFGTSQDANGTGIFTPEDCAANGGTWSSNCYLDGAEIPCGMLMNLVSSPGGAVAPCSDSGCPRTGANGQFQVYAVTHYSDPDCPPTSLCPGIEGHWVNLSLSNAFPLGGGINNASNIGFGPDLGALNYQRYSGIRAMRTLILETARAVNHSVKDLAVSEICGSSPQEAIELGARDGALKGAAYGAVGGFAGGEVAAGIGGIPGAILGGFVGGTVGATGGILWGGFAAVGCDVAGLYN